MSDDIAPPAEGARIMTDDPREVTQGHDPGGEPSSTEAGFPARTATAAVGAAEPEPSHARTDPGDGADDTDEAVLSAVSSTFGFVGAPTGRRMRARLARFNAPWQSAPVIEVLEPLIATHRANHPKADIKLLQRAYEVANEWHAGQYRKSGDPYITHPLAVATILANLGMDTTTLVAALLHDTIEDTEYTLEQMREDFDPGDRAARRRRDQTRPRQARRRREGRDHPQDGRRDGEGPSGARHQTRRPPAQHAYPRLPCPASQRSRRRGRPWRSSPRSPTGWA